MNTDELRLWADDMNTSPSERAWLNRAADEIDALRSYLGAMVDRNPCAEVALGVHDHVETKLIAERDDLRERLRQAEQEVAAARERLGPAGWKMVQELLEARERLKLAEAVLKRHTCIAYDCKACDDYRAASREGGEK